MEPLLQTIAEHANTRAEQAAIMGTNGESIDYRSLLNQIVSIGSELRRRGIKKEDRVALVLNDGPEMAVLYLAVSAHCACAPLNPAYTTRDFAFYLDDLQAKALILADGKSSPAVDVANKREIHVWRLQSSGSRSKTTYSLTGSGEGKQGNDHSDSEDVAMILHTSGTTSRPKMVPLTHQNLACSANNVARSLQLTTEDRGLVVMPLFHIHGLVGALLSAIHAGSSIICTPGFEAASVFRWSRELSATWYSAVPTMHQALLNQARLNPGEADGLTFRVVRSSSASLPPKVFHELAGLWKAPVVESYGMTEAAHQMTSNPILSGTQKPGSVGLPAGPEVAIMNDTGDFLPQGETGSIVIRGDNVTTAYVNNPGANASAFTHGWFQTGDQGYFDEEGYLFLTGRLKEMINRGGENIAPREVDEVLLEHSSIAQATAFAVPHESLGEDLAAAVVLKADMDVTEIELRTFVADRLAPFKVPTRIVMVEAIPKGPTGKLQRIGLHEKLSQYLHTEYKPPRSDIEGDIAGIFAKILKKERVGIEDNFFFLGGDSLQATRVISAITEKYAGDYTVNLVFKNPTVKLLAAYLQDKLGSKDDELTELEKELATLSHEEIESLLAEEGSP